MPPPGLHYSPCARWRPSRRQVRLGLIVAGGLVCVAVCWGVWVGYLRGRLALGRIWHQSEAFSQSPATPVYSTDPLLVPQLLASGYSSWWRDGGRFVDAYREPPAWDDLQRSLGAGTGIYASACAFLHSRRTAGQSDRLVVVRVDAQGDPRGYDPGRQHLLITPVSLRFSWPPPPPSALRFGTGEPLSVILKQGEQFTLFAGQPDPKDNSRFTIRYTMSRKPGTIDGRLRDDGTVTLIFRDGPLAGHSVAAEKN